MLLDALHKKPPRSVDELATFFERSRGRLEQSLDKGQVSGEERLRYLEQFQAGLNEAQVTFLNRALDHQATGGAQDAASANGDVLRSALKQPILWALVLGAVLVGVAIGFVIAA